MRTCNYADQIFVTSILQLLSTDDLAGVKVLHGLDKVMEGGAVVLTLKDQQILADGDINEGKSSLVFAFTFTGLHLIK